MPSPERDILTLLNEYAAAATTDDEDAVAESVERGQNHEANEFVAALCFTVNAAVAAANDAANTDDDDDKDEFTSLIRQVLNRPAYACLGLDVDELVANVAIDD